jgi:uncharacterized protein (TIGR03067 family)
VLCQLEGKTTQEAALELRCPPGTVSSRVTRARQRLRARLTRRGVVLSAGMLTAALTQHTAAAAVRAELTQTAARTGLRYAAGRPVVDRVADLADSFLKTRTMLRWTLVGAAGLAGLLALLLLGVLLLTRSGPDGAPAPPAGPPVAAQADQQLLQGRWQAVAVEAMGQAQPNQGIGFAFAADKIMLLKPDFQGPPASYVLDPAQVPRAIDVTVAAGAVWRGIYELQGDSLKLCLNHNPGGARPATFQTQRGALGVFVYVLRREGARAGGP